MVKTTEFNVQTQMNYVVGNMSGFTAAYTGMNNLSALLSSIMTSYTTLAGTGRAAYMTLGASVAAFGLKSAEAFGEYQRGMNMVKAISNNTNAQMQMLAKSAGEFSGQFRMGIEDINSGLVTLGRAGLTDVNNQIEVLKNGLQVAKISGMDLASTLEDIVTTTSLLGGDIKSNTFGAETKEVSNLLVATSLSGPLNVSDVIETLKFAGGSAAAAGATLSNEEGLHDLLGTIGAFSQKGVTGSIAGTALRAFITKPASQDQKVSDALAKLGLDAYSLWEKDPEQGWHMKPIAEQIGMITKAMNDNHLTNLDRIEVWGDIVGNKMGQQMLKLDENRIKETTKDIEHQRNLEDIYQGTLTTFASQVERLNQIFQAIYRNIGSGFASSLTGIVEGVANILEFINNLGNGVLFKLIAPILGPLGLYGLAKGLTDFVHVLQALRENIAISANTPLEDQDIWQTANGVVAKRYRQAWYDEEKRKNMEERSSGSFSSDEYYREKRERDEKQYRENQEYYAKRRARQEQDYNENQEYQRKRRDQLEKDYLENQEYQRGRRKQLEKDYLENQTYQTDRRNQIQSDYDQNQEYQRERRKLLEKDYQENQAYQKMRIDRTEKDYLKSQEYYAEKRLRDQEFHQLRMRTLASLDVVHIGTQFADIRAQHVVFKGNISAGEGGFWTAEDVSNKYTVAQLKDFLRSNNLKVSGNKQELVERALPLLNKISNDQLNAHISAGETARAIGEEKKKIEGKITDAFEPMTFERYTPLHDNMPFNKQDNQNGIRFRSQEIIDDLNSSSYGQDLMTMLAAMEGVRKASTHVGELLNNAENIDLLVGQNGIFDGKSELNSGMKKYTDLIAKSMGLTDSDPIETAFKQAFSSMVDTHRKTGSYSKFFDDPKDIKAIRKKIDEGQTLNEDDKKRLAEYQRSGKPSVATAREDQYGLSYDPRHKLLETITRQAVHNVLGNQFGEGLREAAMGALSYDQRSSLGPNPTLLELLSPLMTTDAYEHITNEMSTKNANEVSKYGGDHKQTRDAIYNSMGNRGFIDHLDISSQNSSISGLGLKALSFVEGEDLGKLKLDGMSESLEDEIGHLKKIFTGEKSLVTSKAFDLADAIVRAVVKEGWRKSSPGIMAKKLKDEIKIFGDLFKENTSIVTSQAYEMANAMVNKFLQGFEPLITKAESLFTNFAASFEGKLSTAISGEFIRITSLVQTETVKMEELFFLMGNAIQAAYKRGMGIASPGFIYYASQRELNLVKELFTLMSGEIGTAASNLGEEAVKGYQKKAVEMGLAAEQANHIIANLQAGFTDLRDIRRLKVADIPKKQNILTHEQLRNAATYYYHTPRTAMERKQHIAEARVSMPKDLKGLDFETTGTINWFKGVQAYMNDRILSWGLAKLSGKSGEVIPKEGQYYSNADDLQSSPEAALTHKISEEQRKKADSATSAFDALTKAVGSGVKNFVAYNSLFEARMIRSAIDRGVLKDKSWLDAKIYDSKPMWEDFWEKTNKAITKGFGIVPGLGTNTMNSLGVEVNGKRLLNNTLDTVNKFFGRKAETHTAGYDALDGLKAFVDLVDLQKGTGTIVENAKQILFGGQTGNLLRLGSKLTPNDSALTSRDYKRLRDPSFGVWDVSELETVALTTRKDLIKELLFSKDKIGQAFRDATPDVRDKILNRQLYKRARDLNEAGGLGFSNEALSSFYEGIPHRLTDDELKAYKKLNKLQILNKNREFTRNDLVDFVTNYDDKDFKHADIRSRMAYAESTEPVDRTFGRRRTSFLKTDGDVRDPYYFLKDYSKTRLGQQMFGWVDAIREYVDGIVKRGSTTWDDGGDISSARSALRKLGYRVGFGNDDIEKLDKLFTPKASFNPDNYFRGSKVANSILNAVGVTLNHDLPDDTEELESLTNSLISEAEKYADERSTKLPDAKKNPAKYREYLMRGLFAQLSDNRIVTDGSIAAEETIKTGRELAEQDIQIMTRGYVDPEASSSPSADRYKGELNPELPGDHTSPNVVINTNPYRYTEIADLVEELNTYDSALSYKMIGDAPKEGEYDNRSVEITSKGADVGLKEMEETILGKNTSIQKITRYLNAVDKYTEEFGEYDIPKKVSDVFQEQLHKMESNFNKNTNGLNAFWKYSDTIGAEHNFSTIQDVPEYMNAVNLYNSRFDKEYKIPKEFTNFESIANKIQESPKEFRRALAETGVIRRDSKITGALEHIADRISNLLFRRDTIKASAGPSQTVINFEKNNATDYLRRNANPLIDNPGEKALQFSKIKDGINDSFIQVLEKHKAVYDKVSKEIGDVPQRETKIKNRFREYVPKGQEGNEEAYFKPSKEILAFEKDMRGVLNAVGLNIQDLTIKVGKESVPLAEAFFLLGEMSIKAFRRGLEMNSPPKAFTELITYLRETEDGASRSISKLHKLMTDLRTELRSMPEGTKIDIGYADKRLLEKNVYSNSPSLKNELKGRMNVLSTQEEAHAKQREAQEKAAPYILNELNKAISEEKTGMVLKAAFAEQAIAEENARIMSVFGDAIKQANITFKAGSEEWITQLMRTAGVKAQELMTEEQFTAELQRLMLQLAQRKISPNEFATKASELESEQKNIVAQIDKEKALDRKIDRMTQGGLTGKGWQVAYGLGGVGGKIGKGITGALSGAMSFMMNPVVMGAQMIWGYIQQAIEMWKQWEQEKIAKLSEIVSNAESAFDEQQSKWEEAKAKDDEDFSNLSDNEKQDKMLEAIAKAREDTNKNGYIDTDPETKALIGKQNELLRANNALMKEKSTQTLTGYDGLQANWEEFMNGSGMVGEANEYGLLDRLEGLVNPEKYRDDSNTRRLEALQTSLIQIDTRVKNMEEFTDDYQQVMASFGIANKSLLDIYNVRGIADLDDPNFLSGTFFDKSSNVGMGKGGMTAEQMALYMKKQEKILTRFENRFIRFVRKGDRITADLSNADIHTLAKQMGVSDLAAAQMTAVHLLQRIQDVMINQITPQLTEQAVAIYQGNYTLTATDQKESAQTALQKSLDAGIWAIQSQVAQLVYQSTMEQALSDYQAATGDTETNTVGLLLNRARDNSAEFHDIAKQYAAQGLGSFTETSKINEYINAHPGATQEEAINALAKGLTDKNGNGLFDELGEKFAQSEIEALNKHAYDSRADWISRNAGWIGGLAGGGIGATAGFFGGAAVGAVPGWAAGSALGTGAGIALGNLIGGAMGSTMQDTYEGWTDYTNAKMRDFALNVPIDNAVETLNDYMENAESEGDNGGKDTDTSDADKQRYVQLAICNKKAIPKLNVNLFKKAPTFTVLNKNFKLRDIKINTADKAKNIENSLKNAIIDVQERSDPKIIQDSEAEYDPVGATDDATNLPTGASLTK